MPVYRLLNVFTAETGAHGNPLGVFLDGAAIPAAERQRVAAELGYSETVFVDDYLAYPFPPLQLFSTLREHIPEAFGESRWH